jgi:RNA polymerase sigma-70 factor (ECF subfamily)
VGTSQGVPTAPLHPGDISYDDFFRDNFRPMMKMVQALGATRSEAEDAVSAAMEELIRRGDNIAHLEAYGRRVALRTFIKNRQDDQRRWASAVKDADSDPGRGVEVITSESEERRFVLRALRDLPPQQGRILALSVDGYSPMEIAKLIGVNAATVRSNLRLARQRLKTIRAYTDAEQVAIEHQSRLDDRPGMVVAEPRTAPSTEASEDERRDPLEERAKQPIPQPRNANNRPGDSEDRDWKTQKTAPHAVPAQRPPGMSSSTVSSAAPSRRP